MYKKLIEGKKVVIFDLDGTLIDSEPLWKKSFTNILERVLFMGWFDHNEVLAGASVRHKWEYILHKYAEYIPKNTSVNELVDMTQKEYIKIVNETPIETRPGFWELAYELKENKGLKLALASNSPKVIVELILKKIGINSTFDLVLTGDDVKKSKPSPDIYLTTLKQLSLQASEALVFEDSIPGAAAAYQARIDTVIVWDNFMPQSQYPPTTRLFISDFSGLPGKLDTTLEEELQKAAQQQEQSRETSMDIA